MKKKIFLLIPIVGGLTVGQILLRPYEHVVPSGRYEEKLASAQGSYQTVPGQIVSQYLLESQALLSKAVSLSSQNQDSSKNNQVAELINQAITQATQATISAPQDARGYAQRGKIYKTIERYLDNALESALKDFQMASRLAPNQIEYYEEAAKLLVKLNNLPGALTSWQNAAYLNPTSAQAWYELADLQTKLGQIKEAEKSYERILALVIDENQKKEVSKEIQILKKLMSESDFANSTLLLAEDDLVLPDSPPQLEANLARNLIIAEPGDEAEEISAALDSNALSGIAILPAGEKEIMINSNKLKANSQVYLAAIDEVNNEVLKVEAKASGFFKVGISQPLDHEISFRWWIIN